MIQAGKTDTVTQNNYNQVHFWLKRYIFIGFFQYFDYFLLQSQERVAVCFFYHLSVCLYMSRPPPDVS